MKLFRVFKNQLKQEKFRLIVWFLAFAGTSISVVGAYKNIFEDGTALNGIKVTLSLPSMAFMCGPVWNVSEFTLGSLYGTEMTVWMALALAIMNIFLVVRFTREDEESGNFEMLRSFSVGKNCSLISALLLAFLADFLICLCSFIGLQLWGEPSLTVKGTLAYFLANFAIGILFASLTAFFAQIFSSGRITLSVTGAILGVLYIIRGLLDLEYSKSNQEQLLTFFNPLGFILRTKPWTGEENFIPVLVVLAQALFFVILALIISSKRDLNSSLIREKAGKASASFFLTSPALFIMSRLKFQLIIWVLAIFVLGLTYGSVINSVQDFLGSNETLKMMFTTSASSSFVDSFISIIIMVMAIISLIGVSSSCLFSLKEELKGRFENVYSRTVSKSKILTIHLVIGCGFACLLLFASAAGLYISASTQGLELDFTKLIKETFVYLPPTFIIISFCLLVFGFGLRFGSGVVYGYIGYSFLTMYIGRLLNLPDFLKMLTPFYFVKDFETSNSNEIYISSGIMIAISFIILIFSYIAFSKRDLKTV